MGEEKQRFIQEYVPGKQVTLAHLMANPTEDSYQKLGIIEGNKEALGVFTITPSEGAIIAADVALKASQVSLSLVDRFSGSVIITGEISAVEVALTAVVNELAKTLNFTCTEVTRT